MKLTLPVVVAATGGILFDPTLPNSLNVQSSPTHNFSSPVETGTAFTAAQSSLTFEKIVYDSRQVEAGTLFVALPGEVTDGHNYLSEAVAKGATACLVRQDWLSEQAANTLNPAVAWIAVEETLPAFQKLAAWWRGQFPNLPVIGITGSVGKTSTKELISAILQQRYRVFKSPKSINTEQSLLPVLLTLSDQHEVAVIEMGAGFALGELTRLCNVAKPQFGIELGVSHSHLERMGTLENIALNKSELVRALPSAAEGGVAILNGDDFRVKEMAEVTQAKPFFFGLKPEYDLWASDVQGFGLDGIAFTVHYQGEAHHLRLPLLGRHSVYLALAAIAAALLLGVSWDDIEAGLKNPEARVRLLLLPGLNGSTVIDDSYNASIVSTTAALDLLADIQVVPGGRKIAALGNMLELGTYEEEGHRTVGRRAAQVVDYLVVVGNLGQIIGEEAAEHGLAAERIHFAADNAEVASFLQTLLQPGDYLLVKASRGARLDEVVSKVKALP